MTRIAVIGTSHVAMMKTGWDLVSSDWPDIELTFFASPGRAARTKKLQGMVYGYHAAKPGKQEIIVGNDGQRTLDLATFDHVLKVGDSTGEIKLADLVSQFSVDTLGPEGGAQRMSYTAFEDICRMLAERRCPPPPWRGWQDTTLWLVPQPYPDARVLTDKRDRFTPWATLCAAGDPCRAHRDLYLEAYRDALDDHGVRFVDQPPETFTDEGLTLQKYSDGAINIADGSALEDVDFIHMNDHYGALIWDRILTQISDRVPAVSQVA